MKKYFRLFEECLLVNNSTNGGAVYNLISGDVFQYNIFETEILTLCEKKNSIQNILKILNISHEELCSFLDKLVMNNLGFYSDKSVYIEKMVIDYNWKELTSLKERPVVERAYLLLNKDCNCNCCFCNENYIRLNSCVGCFKDTNALGSAITTYNDYLMTLDKLKQLGISTVFFSGGNFFDNFYRNIKIVEYAKKIEIKKIILFLGCNQSVKKDYLEILKQIDINIYVQIPIQDKDSLYNNLLINSIKGILPFSVILLFNIMCNDKMRNEIIEECSNAYSPQEIYIDSVIEIEKIGSIKKSKLLELRRTSIHDYNLSHVYNACMNGLLTITTNRTITVCPKINEPIEKIDNFTKAISSKKINQYWKLTKDKVEGCKDCNIRYICKDCRYIEKRQSGENHKNQICSIGLLNE